ncbi:hypothetical protein FEK30_02675 [Picosynechococcus sp. PCC 11901]|uniref:hypothetical protein n=1 Tax=Picosynechococcus sp. PCC 11901 TaxID=2579791 RepID=UPI0010FC04A5|nr:hypothetical protein [Picosynechococcus sp. PCC 11901]QCS48430.1 hypothetical protein FEK30_02675 [Picosynechococcus sp. PCC 11901]
MDKQNILKSFAEELNSLIDSTDLTCELSPSNAVLTIFLDSIDNGDPEYSMATELIIVELKKQALIGIKLVQFHGRNQSKQIVWSKTKKYPYLEPIQKRFERAALGVGAVVGVYLGALFLVMVILPSLETNTTESYSNPTVPIYEPRNSTYRSDYDSKYTTYDDYNSSDYPSGCDSAAIERQFKEIAGDTVDNLTEVAVAETIIRNNCNF